MENSKQTYIFAMNQYGESHVRFKGEEVEADKIVEDFKKWLLACGFHPDTVNRIHFGDLQEK